MFRTTADPHRFDEAVKWFRARLTVTESQLSLLSEQARQRAWTVAGVAQLDVVQSVFSAIDKANASGTPFETFKKSVGEQLFAEWGRRDSARLETIFRNATQSSLNRGRWAQMTDPEVTRFRPYWMFDAIDDDRITQLCKSLNETVLPWDHPFWATRIPPLHHRCRSGIRSLRQAEAERRGLTTKPPETEAAPGFGKEPGKGDWKPNKKKFATELQRAEKKRSKRNPKPAGHLQEGVHFKQLGVREGIDEADRDRVLMAARKAKLVEFLEREPLGTVFFANTIDYNPDVFGAYWRGTRQLGVKSNISSAFYGNKFVPGKSFGVHEGAKDRIDVMRRTFVHELGHHIHRTSNAEIDSFVVGAWQQAKESLEAGEGGGISAYSMYTSSEYFAESFAAYTFHRRDLRDHDPVGYKMVQKVLRLRGIPR